MQTGPPVFPSNRDLRSPERKTLRLAKKQVLRYRQTDHPSTLGFLLFWGCLPFTGRTSLP